MRPNFQRLLDVIKATENLHTDHFCMLSVFSNQASGYIEADPISGPACGTVGCMIGNYNVMTGREADRFGISWSSKSEGEYSDADHFGITELEYDWLFAEMAQFGRGWSTPERWLMDVTREQALSRLRKFIYYKMHKHEMCYDEKYGVREESRHAEGNHNFASRAKKEAITT